jgi:hypothetical protein
MSANPDRLYELLPVVYRQRDEEQGWPLKALLRVIAEQVKLVEDDIGLLYDNWFIETCEDWVVPYIGDLVGYRPVREAGEPGALNTPQERLLQKILSPRSEVANTIRYRRRKGTLALFELLARQVAGWRAYAVEFYKLLSWTQAMKHLRPGQGQTVDLRWGDALDLLGGPFDSLAHTVDVRRVSSCYQPGRYNIPSIGVYVWRMKSYPVPMTQAYCLERGSAQRYTFSVLANDVPLFTKMPGADAEEPGGPVPILRRAFERRPASFYGEDKSMQITAAQLVGRKRELKMDSVGIERIVAADLSDWERYQPAADQVAVDPELGRILFGTGVRTKEVWVSYYYGFSADIGGGAYPRAVVDYPADKRYRIGKDDDQKFTLHSLSQALEQWQKDKPKRAVIEIADSRTYSEQISLELEPGYELVIRAAENMRPVIRQTDFNPAQRDRFSVTGGEGSKFTFDGILLSGRPLLVEGPLRELALHHVTLVPGWELDSDCEPHHADEYSLELVENPGLRVTIDHSILGSISVTQDEVTADPVEIAISDSILDATNPNLEALDAPARPLAHAVLTVLRTTVIGQIYTHAIKLAEDSIFDGYVEVGRSQFGCMRFCYLQPQYVLPEPRTPRRYHCEPDLAASLVVTANPDDLKAAQQQEKDRVRPQFESTRYGTPTYARLALTCPIEITRGASDESEMGAFHDLFQPQRAVNLQARLDEYAPADMDIGIIYAS